MVALGWAISYLYLIISIAHSTRLDVFQCYKRKNVRKIEEKKEEEN